MTMRPMKRETHHHDGPTPTEQVDELSEDTDSADEREYHRAKSQ